MNKTALALIVVMSGPCYGDASSEGGTGNGFYNTCKQHDTRCQSILEGIKGGALWGKGFNGSYDSYQQATRKIGVCMPDAASWEQRQDVVFQYLENHPESRHELLPELVIRAWHQAWPCK